MTTVLLLSDTHCGSPTGLMRPRQHQLQAGNVRPNALQRIIWRQWVEVAETVAQERDDRLIVIHNGDAVEGMHHGSRAVVSSYLGDHEMLHIDAMDWLLQAVRYAPERGDALYYVAGTASHAGESEERIARDMGAVAYSERRATWPVIRLETPAGIFWVAHHGPGGGRGHTRGNALRNRIRYAALDALADGVQPPAGIIWAHRHTPRHEVWEWGRLAVHGWILPSWQAKTDYAYRVAPFGETGIGALLIQIDGTHWRWRWLTMTLTQQRRKETVRTW